ncbi:MULTISPECIES: MFS transporter [Actinomadura]|uniref:MFS transporter n=1 Tax=Actinomadura litoris TaxID=2678616 RepID=A0A7K1L075_9ACTN|nr:MULTISPECIES: MFS transporter [Actinomadura]MBT2211665.1 MFS transporter [Actinomadura sp. NEAU-AAG7]MUN37841.1 MFS transporter [Actinomadura litoris]
MTTLATPRAGQRTPGSTAALAVPAAATLLALMNYTAPMATLTETSHGLAAGGTARIWLMSSISLGLAAALLAIGSLADDHGRRRVFTGGAVALAVSSVVCAVAPTAPVFVAGRIVQGAASAALLATGLGIIAATFGAGPRRARATGIWGAMLGLGIALGPIASAGLTAAGNWRAWYWVAAAGSVALGVAARSLAESRADRPRGLDLPGLATMSLGIAALVAAITWGRVGWTRPGVLALFAAAAVLLAAFTAIEARRREPMLDLGLLRRRAFLLSISGALVTGLAVIGVMSYFATVLTLVLGLSTIASALVLAIWSGLSFVTALQARRMPARLPAGRLLGAGLALSAVGEFAMIGLTPDAHWWRFAPGLALSGAGSGLANAMLARVAVDSVPADRASMGSGANNTARYLGASVGVAVVGAIATGSGDAPSALAHGTNVAMLVSAVVALLGAALAAALATGR